MLWSEIDQKSNKLLKKSVPILLRQGRLALYTPKPDKNDALNGLILGHEVLQMCSNFFQSDFVHGLGSEIGLEEGLIPTYHETVSWGAWGIRTAVKRVTNYFLRLHAQNFISFKMSYNLLNSDRNYVGLISFTKLTCFRIFKSVFIF